MTTTAPDADAAPPVEPPAERSATAMLVQRLLDELRLVEQLEEHVGNVLFRDQLMAEILHASDTLVRPELPAEGELSALRGYSRPAELVRVSHITRLLQPGDRVLDIGVGRGYVLASLFANAEPAFVHGVDISPRLLDQTRLMVEANDIEPSAISLGTLDVTKLTPAFLRDKALDVILMFEVLEHVSGPQQALTALASAMEDELLIFSVPIQGRIEACWGHKSLFDSAAILSMIQRAGLHLNWVQPVHNMWAVFAVSKTADRADVLGRFAPTVPPEVPAADAMVFTPVRRTSSLSGGGYNTVKGCPDVVFDADGDRPCAFGTPNLAALRLELSFDSPAAVGSVILECRDVDGNPLSRWTLRRHDRIDSVGRSFSFRPGWSDDDFEAEIIDLSGEARSTFLTVVASEPCRVRVHRAHFAPQVGELTLPLEVTTEED